MNALERIEQAVRLLIIGHGDIRARLLSAHEQQLQHVQAGEVPAELAGQLHFILQRLGHNGVTGEVERTVRQLSSSEANSLSLRIFELSCALSQGLYH